MARLSVAQGPCSSSAANSTWLPLRISKVPVFFVSPCILCTTIQPCFSKEYNRIVLWAVYNVIPNDVYIFHSGNNVSSRKVGVTHSFIHSHAVLLSTYTFCFLQTQRALQIFHCKRSSNEFLTRTRHLFFPCVLGVSTVVLNITSFHVLFLSNSFILVFFVFSFLYPSPSISL